MSGTPYPEYLNTDGNGVATSAKYVGGQWILPAESTVADGGDVALGAKADAAVTNPASASSVVGLLKGLLTFLRVSAGGLGKAEDSAHVSGDTGAMVLAVRRDTAAASSGTTGDYEPLQTDQVGRLRTLSKRDATDQTSKAKTAALASSLVVKASPGTLHGITGYVASGADGWIQVHNTTAVPADTAVPDLSVFVPAATVHQQVNIPLAASPYSTGITVVWSTTGPTKTLGGSKLMIVALYD